MKALDLKYQVCDWARQADQNGLSEGTCDNLSAFVRADYVENAARFCAIALGNGAIVPLG